MGSKRKTKSEAPYYKRRLRAIMQQYRDETGIKNIDCHELTNWAVAKGLCDPPVRDPMQDLARAFASAAREEYLHNEEGQPVRRVHRIKEKRNERQLSLWVYMEDATPEQMRLSGRLRYNGMVKDGTQLDRDLQYFNRHHNPGEPIVFDYDLNKMIEERRLPTEYPDVPPPLEDDEPMQS
jgi:hypothetical protein